MRHPLAVSLSVALSFAFGRSDGSANAVDVRHHDALAALPHWTTNYEIPRLQDGPPPANADGVSATVTNCDDAGPGSLRDALAQAPAGSDRWTIDISRLTCSTISLQTGALGAPPDVGTVDVIAPYGTYVDGRAMPSVTIDGNNADRVLVNVYSNTRMNLRGIRLVNGEFHETGPVAANRAAGGCIYSAGVLALYRSEVTGCSIVGNDVAKGGGIYAASTLYLYGSAVDGNDTIATDSGFTYGGGVFCAGSAAILRSWIANNIAEDASYGGGLAIVGNLQLSYSAIASNTSAYAGGISLFTATSNTFIAESTISGNQALGAGAIESWQSVFIESSTVASNRSAPSSSLAGGIEMKGGVLYLANTIVADNDVGDLGGDGIVEGHNSLVVNSALPVPLDTILLDPLLQSLSDNGGLTSTMALSAGSPAIDAGECAVSTTTFDQRELQYDNHGFIISVFGRVAGPCRDIGAFEYGAGDIFRNGFDGT